MRVLVTGALGNLGQAVLDELLARGHVVSAFDVPTPRNRVVARHYTSRVLFFWGDIADARAVGQAMLGQDAVVHLAFVIPRLSATGRGSEEAPAWTQRVNVEGTRTVVEAARSQPRPPRLLFTSSLHVYGRTMHLPPPRVTTDLPSPVEHYARHKVVAERLVRESGVPWAIFRLGAALPVRVILDPGMFDVALDNRIEFVHRRDVALAVANALETEDVWGRVWHIGGGERCQFIYRDMVRAIMETVGIGMLPEEAFSPVPYPTDWLDTRESQAVLNFQRHTFDDYLNELRALLGPIRRRLITAFRPLVRFYLLLHSPYLTPREAWRWAWRIPEGVNGSRLHLHGRTS